MNWTNVQNQQSRSYKCGHCGSPIASEKGYYATGLVNNINTYVGWIYICHKCTKPTFFDSGEQQIPGVSVGNPVKHITEPDIEKLYDEARVCYSVGAFTSSVMSCRKLLMNISVTEGAPEGKGFVEYVNYLNDNNFIPPKGKEWVDSIRRLGNEANHKIEFRSKEDATRIINFTEMLLRFIYELPGIMKESEIK